MNVSLPPDWAEPPTPASHVGDLLPDELENSVLAMKTNQSSDSKAVRRTTKIIANHKALSYDKALHSLVEILSGILDVG
jgi:hypothetical protein